MVVRWNLLLAVPALGANKRVAQGGPVDAACTEAGQMDDGSTYSQDMSWTAAGATCRPTCVDETATHAVQCCSFDAPTDPPFDTSYEGVACTEPVQGTAYTLYVSRKPDGASCPADMSYAAAKTYCATQGGRLCSEHELWTGGCTGGLSETCGTVSAEFVWVESDVDGPNGKVCEDYELGGAEDRNETWGTTSRDGVESDDSLTAPDMVTGTPYQDDQHTVYNADGNYTDAAHTADQDVLDSNTDNGDACSAKGFKCDFSQYAQLGVYDPMDFAWKILDPTDYGKPGYEQQTLNCEVKVTGSDSTANQGNTTYDYFYVPTGQDNVDSQDYCDVEGIRRTINDTALEMTDMIRVRAETARVNNNEGASRDLVGEQFDVICKCETSLSTEASLSVENARTALLTVMSSTGQQRELMIELLLYSSPAMEDDKKIAYPQPFPDDQPHFHFLAKHLFSNDWDVKLQINACVACEIEAGTSCSTSSSSAKAVFFYQTCSTLLGGPQIRPPTGWYAETGGNTIATEWLTGDTDNRWADADPYTTPYAHLGVQKFRLAGRGFMMVSCQVSGCSSLPCPPCTTRRSLATLFRKEARQLQEESTSTVELGMALNAGMGGFPYIYGEGGQQEEAAESKKASMSYVLLIIVGVLALAAIGATLHLQRKRAAQETAAKVNVSHQ